MVCFCMYFFAVKVLRDRFSFIGLELIMRIKNFQDFCLSEEVDISNVGLPFRLLPEALPS